MAYVTVTIQSEWSEREADLETGDAEVCEYISIRRLVGNNTPLTEEVLQRFAGTAAQRVLLCHHLTIEDPVVTRTGEDWNITYTMPGYTHEQARQCMCPIFNTMTRSLG